MPENLDAAEALAARFYDILREALLMYGRKQLFTIHEWAELAGEQKEALKTVFDKLILEAREQKEVWTRSFIEQERARMLREIESGVTRASLSVASEIEEKQRRGEWHAIEKPPLGKIRSRGEVEETIRQLDETRVEVIGRAMPSGRNEKAARQLLQLRNELNRFAQIGEDFSKITQGEGAERVKRERADTSERVRLFAVELESIVYETGLAEKGDSDE